MNSWKDVLIAIGVALGTAYLFWQVEDRPGRWVKPLTDLQVAEAWLQCIDCRGPFLKQLHEMSAKNRDTVTQFLGYALLKGPDSSRRLRNERDLARTWRADSLRRVRRGQAVRPDSERVAFLNRYKRSFVVIWRSRAAIGLGVIRSGDALAALDSAAHLPVSNSGDSTVRSIVEQAIADSARAVLSGAVPTGGTQTGRVSGRVLDPQGTPVANVQVTVVGTSIAAMTGTDGQYILNRIPPGTHTLRVRRIGYQVRTVTVTITPGQTTNQSFTLRP